MFTVTNSFLVHTHAFWRKRHHLQSCVKEVLTQTLTVNQMYCHVGELSTSDVQYKCPECRPVQTQSFQLLYLILTVHTTFRWKTHAHILNTPELIAMGQEHTFFLKCRNCPNRTKQVSVFSYLLLRLKVI